MACQQKTKVKHLIALSSWKGQLGRCAPTPTALHNDVNVTQIPDLLTTIMFHLS